MGLTESKTFDVERLIETRVVFEFCSIVASSFLIL